MEGYIRSDLLVFGEEARVHYRNVHGFEGTVTASALNVRTAPDLTAGILGTEPQGDEVKITGEENGWYQVNYQGQTAYVSAEYISPEEPDQTALTLDEYQQRQEAEAAAAQAQTDSSSSGGSVDSSSDAYQPVSGTGALMWPVNGVITSPFGYRNHPIFGRQILHSGIDIGVDYGTPVHAADSGVVVEADWISGYGYAVVIDHGNGLSTLYGHNESLAVSAGQSVSKGQVIAYAGSTGNSTGPHVHFEVRSNGEPVDPMGYL